MSRTVFGLVAVGAAVIAIAVAVAWRGKMSDQAALDRPPAVIGGPAPESMATVAPKGAAAAAATVPAPTTTPTTPTPPAATSAVPTFDVARIGSDGRAVIAGRAAPGAKIVLLDGGKEIAKAESDTRGEWVVIVQDPPLTVGQHELRVVQHIEGKAPLTSEQAVVAVVPEPPAANAPAGQPRAETLVMISPRAGAATLVQPPSAAGVPKSADLSLSTLDYDDRGHVTISGLAAPGTVVRAYVNDRPVAEGVAAPTSLAVEAGCSHRPRQASAETRPHRQGRQAPSRASNCRSSVSSWSRFQTPMEDGCTSCGATISGTSPRPTMARAGAIPSFSPQTKIRLRIPI